MYSDNNIYPLQSYCIEDIDNRLDYAHIYNDIYNRIQEKISSLLSYNLNSFKRFIVVRNPYKRLVSSYNYKFQYMTKEDFFNMLYTLTVNNFKDKKYIHLIPQHMFYTSKDIILKLENLQDDLLQLSALNEDCKELLKHKKSIIHGNQSSKNIPLKHFLMILNIYILPIKYIKKIFYYLIILWYQMTHVILS